MENKKTRAIVAAAFAGLLLLNTIGVWKLKAENEELRARMGNMQNTLMEQMISLDSSISGLKGDIQAELEKGASLLTESGVALTAEDGLLAVSAYATPKELSSGDAGAMSGFGYTQSDIAYPTLDVEK